MFICDDPANAVLSAVLEDDHVAVTASSGTGTDQAQRVFLTMSATTIRGMIEELSAMADELDTATLAAETAAAAADAEREAAADAAAGGPDVTAWCWYEWRTAANHLTACAQPRYHDGPHRDALGQAQQLRPRRSDDLTPAGMDELNAAIRGDAR